MTPDERDRLTRVEEALRAFKEDQTEMRADIKTLISAFNIGKGKAVANAKLGGTLLVIFSAIVALWDHVIYPLIHR